jgi:hypothetical protein
MVQAIKVYTETAREKGFTLPEPDGYANNSQLKDWSHAADSADAEVTFSAPVAPDDVWEPEDGSQWPEGHD